VEGRRNLRRTHRALVQAKVVQVAVEKAAVRGAPAEMAVGEVCGRRELERLERQRHRDCVDVNVPLRIGPVHDPRQVEPFPVSKGPGRGVHLHTPRVHLKHHVLAAGSRDRNVVLVEPLHPEHNGGRVRGVQRPATQNRIEVSVYSEEGKRIHRTGESERTRRLASPSLNVTVS